MQGLPQYIQFTAALVTLILASIWDIRTHRIPNAVTIPAILIGLVLTAIFRLDTMPLTVIALVLLFFFGALNLMGQGDIKLIMAITAICGLTAALISTGIAAILIVGIQILLYPNETASEAKNVLSALFSMKLKKIDKDGRSVPFAPYILAGFIYLFVYRLLLQ